MVPFLPLTSSVCDYEHAHTAEQLHSRSRTSQFKEPLSNVRLTEVPANGDLVSISGLKRDCYAFDLKLLHP